MKKSAKLMGLILAGAMIAAMTGCANKPVEATKAAAPAATTAAAAKTTAAAGAAATTAAPAATTAANGKVTVRIGGGPANGANYTTFAGIGNLISMDHPNYICSTEISTGSQENIRMIKAGTVDFGVAMSDCELAAFKGEREFQGDPVAICHVMGGYSTMLHMIVAKDSPINSIADLKGKKCAISKGAMAQYYFPILLQAYGLTKDDVTITEIALQDICDAIGDGNADFGVHITPYTSSPIADLAATKGIKLLSIDEEHIKKIHEISPYFFDCVIPGGTYTGIDQDTHVVGTRNNLICGKNVPDEIVYNVTKSIIEHQADLKDVHPQAVKFNTENAIDGALIDIHPGAAKYYKEIGLMK